MTTVEPELQQFLPTPERAATAQRLLELHTRICVPEPTCHWCFKRWPCPDARWSQQVLTRGRAIGMLA
jgi:endonuclease III